MYTPQLSNKDFLRAIFGVEHENVHVGAKNQMLGGFASKITLSTNTDQYYTVSLFTAPTRRKELFKAAYILVADDVGTDKAPLANLKIMPEPSYKLETSAGNEQWGWIFDKPCADAAVFDALVDSLVAHNCTDAGAKSVTRYVRLPGGVNTKKERLNADGTSFKCKLVAWNPQNKYSTQTLANALNVNLDFKRKKPAKTAFLTNTEAFTHPIFNCVDIVGAGDNGWVRINCVNAKNHSSDDAAGAAIRITRMGDVQYECHHAHCQGIIDKNGVKKGKITGNKALDILSTSNINLLRDALVFKNAINYRAGQKLAKITGKKKRQEVTKADADSSLLFDPLRYIHMFNDNKIYDTVTSLLVTHDSLNKRYIQEFPVSRKTLSCSDTFFQSRDRTISDAEGLTWRPTGLEAPARCDLIETKNSRRLVNTWGGIALKPAPGDVSPWLEHARYLIHDDQERSVVLDYLASIFQRISEKPDFALIHCGTGGAGKDMFYRPIATALGKAAGMPTVDDLLKWGDYSYSKKLIILPEVEKGHDRALANALKKLVTSSALEYEDINLKGGAIVSQYDCKAIILMSNRNNPIALEHNDRRYFAVDSYIAPKPPHYYTALSNFYASGGCASILDYLMQRDLSNFNHKSLPFFTSAAKRMMRVAVYDYVKQIEDLIDAKVAPFNQTFISPQKFTEDLNKLRIGGNHEGRIDAITARGYAKLRGARKIDGNVKNTPWFFIAVTELAKFFGTDIDPLSLSKRQVYDYYTAHICSDRLISESFPQGEGQNLTDNKEH